MNIYVAAACPSPRVHNQSRQLKCEIHVFPNTMPGANREQMKVHSLHRRSKGRAWIQLEDVLLARTQAALCPCA